MKRNKATVGMAVPQQVPFLYPSTRKPIVPGYRINNVAGARYSEYVPKIDAEKPKNVAQRLK
jgi:hypothetical protein